MTQKHAEIKRRDENHSSESIEDFDQEKIDEKLILLAQLMADQCILQAKKLLKNEKIGARGEGIKGRGEHFNYSKRLRHKAWRIG